MKELVELTEKLMRFKTTAERPFELDRCIGFMDSYFAGLPLVVRRHVKNGRPSLVVLTSDTKRPEIFLSAHADVVPAEDRMFEPSVSDGRIYGRGSVDNKASLAIMMVLLKELSQRKPAPDVGMMVTTDEETGGRDGVKYLLDEEGYGAEFALVLDGGEEGELVTEEKGALHVVLRVKGKTTHGSHPWKGENAIDRLIDFYVMLKKRFPDTTEKNRWKQTISLGVLNGGDAVNKVPDSAEMQLDMRFVSDAKKAEVLEMIHNAPGISYHIISDANMLITDKRNRYVKALKMSAEKVGGKCVFAREHGASDGRYFADHKIPVALMLPEGGEAHSDEEYVDIASMERLYLIVRDFVDSTARNV